MNRMDTVPSELNLVKKVADFRLMRGKTRMVRKRGTVVNWPQTMSNMVVSGTTGEKVESVVLMAGRVMLAPRPRVLLLGQ